MRRVISGCFLCNKVSAVCGEQLMSDLPKEKLMSEEPPFTHVGVDYFGTLYVRQGRSNIKRYGCLFTCLAVRAVHIEVLFTDEMLQTLMAEVAGILNSRPLTPVSSDPKDLEPLTPNHLLSLRSNPSLLVGSFSKEDSYSKRRWRQVQYISDIFCNRRLVSSVGRAPVCRAGGRGFKPRPDQHSGSLNN